MTVLRGFTIGDLRDGNWLPPEPYFHDLAATGAAIGRIFIRPVNSGGHYDLSPSIFAQLDAYVAKARALGIVLVICAQLPDAGYNGAYWADANARVSFQDLWKNLAARYANAPVWFDLMNEPAHANDSLSWTALSQGIIDQIRLVAQNTIVWQPANGAMPSAFSYAPPKTPNMIASLHMYEPYALTHNGMGAAYPLDRSIAYPSAAWTEGYLKGLLDRVQAWSKQYNTPIIVGEFSCARWNGKSRDAYIADCVTLFESYGWSWIYHAWRQWGGWDAENDADNTNPADATRNAYAPAITALRRALSRRWAGQPLP
jgi:endoglucanase